jgi:hypothetical protein
MNEQNDPMSQAAGPIRPRRPVLADNSRVLLEIRKAEVKTSSAGNDMLVLELGAKEGIALTDRDNDPILQSFNFIDRTVLNGDPDTNARKLRKIIYSVEKVEKGGTPPYTPAQLKAEPSRLVGKLADVTVKVEVDANGVYDDKNSVKIWWTP